MASPHAAAAAGGDCLAAMASRKLRQAAPWLEEAGRAGLTYRPVTFSCYGRASPEAAAAMQQIARRAARRQGLGSPALVLRRLRARVGVELWRRSVAVMRSCLPGTAAAAELLGAADAWGAAADSEVVVGRGGFGFWLQGRASQQNKV